MSRETDERRHRESDFDRYSSHPKFELEPRLRYKSPVSAPCPSYDEARPYRFAILGRFDIDALISRSNVTQQGQEETILGNHLPDHGFFKPI